MTQPFGAIPPMKMTSMHMHMSYLGGGAGRTRCRPSTDVQHIFHVSNSDIIYIFIYIYIGNRCLLLDT